jgi:tRNA dimethylallyltransferase
MRDAGLVDEVRRLAADPRGWSRTARQAIGYKEVLAHLEGEEPDLETALDAAVRRTSAFARRQRVWFRRDPRITWFGTAGNSCATLPALLSWWSR